MKKTHLLQIWPNGGITKCHKNIVAQKIYLLLSPEHFWPAGILNDMPESALEIIW